jgi:hypothetical protein
MMEQFDRFTATFRPESLDDLKPAAAEWIGWRGEWEVLWVIEEEDNRRYAGQFACGVVQDQDGAPPPGAFVWVPQCDLDRGWGPGEVAELLPHNQLIAETEAVLGATATAEDFAASMERVHRAIGFTPEQMAALAAGIKDSMPPTRRQRLARRLRPFHAFCERLGTATLALPVTAPAFAREFWRELRSGDPLAWAALAKGFAAGMFVLSVGLWASAASG